MRRVDDTVRTASDLVEDREAADRFRRHRLVGRSLRNGGGQRFGHGSPIIAPDLSRAHLGKSRETLRQRRRQRENTMRSCCSRRACATSASSGDRQRDDAGHQDIDRSDGLATQRPHHDALLRHRRHEQLPCGVAHRQEQRDHRREVDQHRQVARVGLRFLVAAAVGGGEHVDGGDHGRERQQHRQEQPGLGRAELHQRRQALAPDEHHRAAEADQRQHHDRGRTARPRQPTCRARSPASTPGSSTAARAIPRSRSPAVTSMATLIAPTTAPSRASHGTRNSSCAPRDLLAARLISSTSTGASTCRPTPRAISRWLPSSRLNARSSASVTRTGPGCGSMCRRIRHRDGPTRRARASPRSPAAR